MKGKLWTAAALALTAVALTAAGCGDDDDNDSSASTTEMSHAASTGGTDTGGAELRATLTAGLQEHVYLAGIAIANGVQQGLDSPEFEAAAATLDANSVALSEAIGSVYGADAGKQFLALWRDHIGFFVDYTKAKAEGDAKGGQQARKKLDGYRAEFGAFLSSANPELTQEAVADELKPHVESLFTAIDAAVAGSPDVFDLLREAAGHMPDTANTLAGAIAAQFPEKYGS
jgi:hypothetical protein